MCWGKAAHSVIKTSIVFPKIILLYLMLEALWGRRSTMSPEILNAVFQCRRATKRLRSWRISGRDE